MTLTEGRLNPSAQPCICLYARVLSFCLKLFVFLLLFEPATAAFSPCFSVMGDSEPSLLKAVVNGCAQTSLCVPLSEEQADIVSGGSLPSSCALSEGKQLSCSVELNGDLCGCTLLASHRPVHDGCVLQCMLNA